MIATIRRRAADAAAIAACLLPVVGIAHAANAERTEQIPTTPCAWEDKGRDCFWDAGVVGNGNGQSFWRDSDGRVHYLDSQQ